MTVHVLRPGLGHAGHTDGLPGDDPTDRLTDDEVDGLWPAEPRRLVAVAGGLTPDAAPRGGPDDPRSRFTTYTPAQLRELPPLEWLVAGMIPAGGLAAVVGPPKSGKTFLVLDLANSVASGRPFLGRDTQRGGVLYLSAEGRAGLPDRDAAWQQAHGVPDHARDIVYVLQGANLLEPEDARHLAWAAEQSLATSPALIVVDTLARVSGGGDENSAADIGTVIHYCDWLRERTGAAVLLVHHTNASGERERGSTALRGAVDVLLMVADEDGRRLLTCEAIKDGEAFDPVAVELDTVWLADGASSCVPRLSASHWTDGPDAADFDRLTPNQLKALAALELAGARGCTYTQWSETAGLAKRTFARAVAALNAGRLVDQPAGSVYKTTSSGTAALRWAREQGAERRRAVAAAGRSATAGATRGATVSATDSAVSATVGATRRGVEGGVGGGGAVPFTTPNSPLSQPPLRAAERESTDLDRARARAAGAAAGATESRGGATVGATGSAAREAGTSAPTRSRPRGGALPPRSGRDRAAGRDDDGPPAWEGPQPWED